VNYTPEAISFLTSYAVIEFLLWYEHGKSTATS